jgi:hypothetical protein
MALTDADRLQMTAMALMRYSVVATGGGSTHDSIQIINFFSVVDAPGISSFTLTEDE